MKIKNHVFLTALLLGYFTFSSCSEKKHDANEKRKNPFGTASGIGTGILQPSHWSFTVEQNADGEATLISSVKLDSGWHLYSQQIPDKHVATKFKYDGLSTYKLVGDTEEGIPTKKYDAYLEMEVLYFENEAVFKQKIELDDRIDFTITGAIDYLVCLDQSQCVNANEEFSFNVKSKPF